MCQGEGSIKVPMQFMADITLTCEACTGRRFKDEVLEVKYRGKSCSDILNMSVDEAIAFFAEDEKGCRRIIERLQTLSDVVYLQTTSRCRKIAHLSAQAP